MKKIKTLVITFDKELASKDIPKFRGAILNNIENPDILFHNHFDNSNKLNYRYPLIQYKTIDRKAALFCIANGVDVVHEFFRLPEWSININNKKIDIAVENVNVNQFVIQAWDKYFDYNIYNWLPLNEKNYRAYKELTADSEKIFFLERILRGNILSFGRGIECEFEREVKVQIIDIKKEKTLKYKDVKMHAVDAVFKTNVFLPNYVGLGKGTRIGFGVVREKKSNNK